MNRKALAWILYDAGNSAYSTIIVTAYFVLYFKSVVVGDPHRGDFLWGLSISIAMLLLAVSSPYLGGIADRGGHRRLFLVIFTLLAVACTLSLAALGPGMILAAMALFILAEIGFEGGSIFYDSFLGQVSRPGNVGRISGYGFAVGYAGGILSLLLALPFLRPQADGTPSWSVIPLLLAALQFLVLATPALFSLTDRTKTPGESPRAFRARELLAKRRAHPDLFRLLLAYLIFYDGIATVISFAAAFAFDTLGFKTSEIIWLILISNMVAIPGAATGGWLCDRIGGKQTILATLLLWIGTVLAIVLTDSKPLFLVLTGLIGVGLGSTQGATRALYARFVPEGEEGQFFALKGICGKFASIAGPVLFGLISYATHSQRLAAGSLLVFFIVGFFLVSTLDERRGIEAGGRNG